MAAVLGLGFVIIHGNGRCFILTQEMCHLIAHITVYCSVKSDGLTECIYTLDTNYEHYKQLTGCLSGAFPLYLFSANLQLSVCFIGGIVAHRDP